MTAQSYCRLTALIFTIVAVLQLTRAVLGVEVTAGTMAIPVWASWIAAAVATALAWLGFGAAR